jgi:putative nucleotide binding protein
MGKDEYAYVVEYLPYGHADFKDRRPSVIILTDSLALLLATLKKDVNVEISQKVYIGEGKRDQIHHIIGKITPDKLSETGLSKLKELLDQKIKEYEAKFVSIINALGPVNVRLHAVELIPGIGKKLMVRLLDERKKQQFSSYADINSRLGLTSGIEKYIEDRIMEEMAGDDKYRIFS